MNLEKRLASAATKTTGRTLSGIAVPYGVEATIGNFTERFSAGSLTRTLASRPNGRDIVALVNHDDSALLGRTASNTLRLQDRADGLHFELDLPRTPLGDEILALQKRGDLGGISFSFASTRDSWIGDSRTVEEAQLYEISIIKAFSAYPNADTLSVRSLQANAETDMRRRLYAHYLGGAI